MMHYHLAKAGGFPIVYTSSVCTVHICLCLIQRDVVAIGLDSSVN